MRLISFVPITVFIIAVIPFALLNILQWVLHKGQLSFLQDANLLAIFLFINFAFAVYLSIFFLKRIVFFLQTTDNGLSNLSKAVKEGIPVFNDDQAVPFFEIKELLKKFNDVSLQLFHKDKKLQQQRQLAIVGETSAFIAHDTKRPFSLLKELLNNFELFAHDPEAMAEAKAEITLALNNVEKLFADIHNFAQTQPIEKQSIPLKHLVLSALKEVETYWNLRFLNGRVTCSWNDLQIKIRLSSATDVVIVNEIRMINVLCNIIENGLEAIAGQNEKVMYINSERDLDGKISIKISNNGPTISEENLSNIFTPFFTSGKKRGKGLGLASALKNTEMHGGTISVKNIFNSDGIEQGVQFIIEIPPTQGRENAYESI